MSDLTITPDAIASALKSHIESWKPDLTVEEVGRVLETGDGIAQISGLPNCRANEILELPHNLQGLAFNLEETTVGAIILGDASLLQEGDPVRQTGRILSVPVGDGMLGRVVNALGEPIDGAGPIQAEAIRPLEVQAASVVERQPVTEPLQTGIKAIDAMTNVGRGQRELIIGDRQTGKTTIGIDTIIAQKIDWGTPKQVKCIYVAVGQKASSVREIQARLTEMGAMEYTVIVVAAASDPAPFRYLAPYAGAAIGAHWMYKGEHALVVYDDLSKQADAYRQLSLLLRRPPGREAYPGDVFYLHSRLLERAAKLSDELGGGSLTALPIIETKGGDVSGFIPTNVISITDGQIFLESDLFYQGQLPAVNVGTSVSRVGGSAQTKAMKKIAGRMRLDLASFRELEAFAQFGSDLDKSSQDLLNRGRRLLEITKQGQYSPVPVEEEIVQIFAGTGLPDARIRGLVDDIPVGDVQRFIREMTEFLRSRHNTILETLKSTGDLTDDLAKQLAQAIEEFKATFQKTEA